MAKYNSIDHALHNEKVCKYLNKKPENADWVITTAFYAALHFVRSKIFPFTATVDGKDITIADFNSYCLKKQISSGKHRALFELVEEKMPQLADKFNHLKDISWTARYNRYEYTREVSNFALEELDAIKSQCL
ncbi:MAG: hypothetical protein LBC59_00745 [Chitinispirillales bacterium]|jgi:hypothetical protein|nr:hypothetical protein [Chitinispirillales bacterium]